MRRLALLGLVLLVAAVAGVPDGTERPWADGTWHGRWTAVFNGYGEVRPDGDDLLLAPLAPAGPDDTHAALVVTSHEYADFAATVRLRTDAQLRTPVPNAWEVGWVLWHYTGPGRFYALALKPTGWELSKQDPRYPGGQRFLASGRTPTFPVGTWHTVGVVQVGGTIEVAADDVQLARYVDRVEPYRSGSLGLYTEDARVHFTGIEITSVPDVSG
jgi:hypothetical protein